MQNRRSLVDDFLDERDDSVPWMVTYGDMMTLLLVFFILLYSVFFFQTEQFKKHLARLEIEIDQRGTTVSVLEYAARLTLAAAEIDEAEITRLREAGFDDGEILELNQVSAYFAYANRTVLGLGITTAGDIIGLSPGDSSDPDNWSHQ